MKPEIILYKFSTSNFIKGYLFAKEFLKKLTIVTKKSEGIIARVMKKTILTNVNS